MGNVKELAQKDAMQRIDRVIEKLLHGIIKRDDAVRAIRKIPNVELVIDRSSIEDHVDEALSDFQLEKDDPIPTSEDETVLIPPKQNKVDDEDDDFIKEFERNRG